MIIKIQKREPGFVMIDNRVINDPRLSWKAKGILVYLLSKPNDWKVWVEDIQNRGTDRGAAIRAALKELIQCGYAKRARVCGPDGRVVDWSITIYEEPDGGFPHVDNPHVVFPHVENQQHSNTELTNTESSNTELKKTEEEGATPQPPAPSLRVDRMTDAQEALALWCSATGMMAYGGYNQERLPEKLIAIIKQEGSFDAAAALCKRAYQAMLTKRKADGREYSKLSPVWLDWALAHEIPGDKPEAKKVIKLD